MNYAHEPVNRILPERPTVVVPLADPRAMTGVRSVRLVMVSARGSGARMDAALLDERGSPLGPAVRLSVDWTGRNDLELWPRSFLFAAVAGQGAARCAGVRLSVAEPGVWPTDITVERAELLDTEPVWPVEGPDTVIDCGWSYIAAAPDRWRLDRARSTVEGGAFVQSPERSERTQPGREAYAGELEYRGTAPWLTLGYTQEGEARTACLVRDFDLPLGPNRELLFKATWDSGCLLSATAETDAGDVVVCRAEAPSSNFRTFGAKLSGTMLRRVRLNLTEQPQSPRDKRDVTIGLFWVLLRRPSELDRLPHNEVEARLFGIWDRLDDAPRTGHISVPMPPFVEPPESRTPVGDPTTDGLPFGFLVSRANIAQLRSRCLGGRSSAMFEAMRREADRAIATELTDRNTYGNALPWGGVGKPKGYRGAGMRIFAPLTAFVHLVTGEPRYAVACRRWILRAAASDRWIAEHGGPSDIPRHGEEMFYDDIFTGTHPQGFWGYMDHHFFVADAAYGIAAAYDMLYHCFSPRERDVVEGAMAEHGLFHLWDKMLAGWDFYVRMNQGVLIGLPLLMQTAFLKRRDPVYARLHERTVDFLTQFCRLPWNAEGVMGEGPSYGCGTLAEVVETLPALAACTGKPVESFLPLEPWRLLEYLCHCRSTWRTPGPWPHFVGFSDGGEYGWIGAEVLVFYARRLRSQAAEFLLRELEEPDHPTIANVLFDGEPPEPVAPALPPAHAFRDQPMVFYRTGWREGDALLAMNAIRQVTCHGHKDRGTFVFELGGEALVTDPGMLSYNDTRARQYQETFCHNCLTVEGSSQTGGFARHDVNLLALHSDSGPSVPGDPAGVDWAVVDLTAVYPEALRYLRHLIFLRPGTVVVFDDLELRESGKARLNFTLLGAITGKPPSFRSDTPHAALTVASATDGGYGFETLDWATHWTELTAHRLVLSAERARKRFGWLTVLCARPRDASRLVGLGRAYYGERPWQRFAESVAVRCEGADLVAEVATPRGAEQARFRAAAAGPYRATVERTVADAEAGPASPGRAVAWDGESLRRRP